MKINRRGARADHGLSSIEFRAPVVSWVKSDSTLTIKQSDVKDFSTTARHSYSVKASMAEVNEFLKALATAASEDPSTFEKGLEPSLKALIKLQHIVSGLSGG